MSKINWKRTKKFREIEEKYDPGTVMRNGRVVSDAPRDSLAKRAAKAEAEWLGGRSAKAAKQRATRRHKKKPRTLTPGEVMRMRAIRSQLAAVMDDD